MAALSTIPPPSSVQISGKILFRQVPNRGSVPWRQMTTTKLKIISSVGSSGDMSAEYVDVGSEAAVEETPRDPPSLISSLNVQRALRGIPITDVDHYGSLGLPRSCSYDQVEIAYRNKLDEEEVSNKTKLLKEPEEVGPTRVVGYILLGWFILAAALSISFNR